MEKLDVAAGTSGAKLRTDSSPVRQFSANDLGNETRRLEWLLRAVAILLGLLQAWATRDSVDNDTVSYLDMGDAWLRGDWNTGINGNWNPLYGILLSVALKLSGASAAHEYAVVHGVALVCFLLALAAFGFFLRELLKDWRPGPADGTAIPARTWVLLAYVLFTWSSLDLIGVFETNPDMLIAALIYVASGLLLRIRRNPVPYRDYVWLAVVLGVAYLVKQFMFFGSFAFLLVATLLAARGGAPVRKAVVMSGLFLLIAAPFIAALSFQRGHLTVGESGRINYAWYVNKVVEREWQGGPASAGVPMHPPKKIVANPPTYEFDRPIAVTYPLWYDPSYWYEGVHVVFSPKDQFRVFTRNMITILEYALGAGGSFACGLLILLALKPRWHSVRVGVGQSWHFALPSAVAVGLYALVHVEPRYLGAFMVLTLLATFLALARNAGTRDIVRAIAVAAWVLLLVPVIGRTSSHTPRYYAYLVHPSWEPVDPFHNARGPSTANPWKVAAALRARGFKPGDRVGTVQPANAADAAWARLARLKIVTEVRPEVPDHDFWHAPANGQRQVLDAMTGVGVRAIVSDTAPADGNPWVPLGQTGPLGKAEYFELPAAPNRPTEERLSPSSPGGTPSSGNGEAKSVAAWSGT